MAGHSKFRFVSYARDMTLEADKFKELDRLVREAKTRQDVDAVVVASPQVLGDTYEELIANLNKLADAELAVVVVPPRVRDQVVAQRN